MALLLSCPWDDPFPPSCRHGCAGSRWTSAAAYKTRAQCKCHEYFALVGSPANPSVSCTLEVRCINLWAGVAALQSWHDVLWCAGSPLVSQLHHGLIQILTFACLVTSRSPRRHAHSPYHHALRAVSPFRGLAPAAGPRAAALDLFSLAICRPDVVSPRQRAKRCPSTTCAVNLPWRDRPRRAELHERGAGPCRHERRGISRVAVVVSGCQAENGFRCTRRGGRRRIRCVPLARRLAVTPRQCCC